MLYIYIFIYLFIYIYKFEYIVYTLTYICLYMYIGWNKFCFTGGIIEISAQLPGAHNYGGMWPALWLMGNLARATYVGSSENVWPWSSQTCSRKHQRGQLFSACT